MRRWVSRFDIYPYLERYTVDAAAEINSQVRPHLTANALKPSQAQ